MRKDSPDDVRQAHRGDGTGAVQALLTGGDPSVQWHLAQILTGVHLEEAGQAQAITILEGNLDRSGDWIVTNVTFQALAVFARTSPAVRARLVERLHHYRHSPYKSVASRARKLLPEFDTKPAQPTA